ncbi:MAG: hypothetical protein KDA89_01710 [Planctomycetaceae bacterium]|nr:hypothetical protein [Planctomycetaceae bacterium]
MTAESANHRPSATATGDLPSGRQPPPLPSHSGEFASVPCEQVPSNDGTNLPDESPFSPRHPWLRLICASTATGWVLSLLCHTVAYPVGALLFFRFGPDLFRADQQPIQIRASLDDQDVKDAEVKLEITQELTLGEAKPESSIQRISDSLQVSDVGLTESIHRDLLANPFSQSDGQAEPAGEGGRFLFKLPKSGLAVTKGSFTAWTVPETPEPQQPYMIIIEVRLPDDVKRYRITDLDGYVRGSDSYRQRIPFDPRAKFASFYTDENQKMVNISGSDTITVRDNIVQLAIQIPGALRLVRDVIEIRSRRLRERQELELVFGGTTEKKRGGRDEDN